MSTDVDVLTGEIVPTAPTVPDVLTPAAVAAMARRVRDIKRAALTEGTDYGLIPGAGDRPALFKSGAETLLRAENYTFTMRQRPSERDGVMYACTVRRWDGSIVAQCEGYAGYDESRYFISAEDATRRERYNAEKYQRRARPERTVEYRAPWNTLVKMAQKRALVGAALNACAASGLFVADVDDSPSPAYVDAVAEVVAENVGETAASDSEDPPCNDDDTDPTGLVADLNAATRNVRRDFMAWVRARGFAWPPTEADVLVRCASELEALTQRAGEGSSSHVRP
jgi:hypothetical protein